MTTELPGMAAARVWASVRFPYLASAIFAAEVVVAPVKGEGEVGGGGMSVDERWRLRTDPAVTADWTPAQLGSVLVHHVSHLLRQHAERARCAAVSPDDSAAWVQAADAEINDDLVAAGLDLPGNPVLPSHFRMPTGRLAEEYFAASASDEARRLGQWGHCGSGADGSGSDGDQSGLDRWRAELVRRQVARDVLRHGQEAGTVPAGLLRWAAQTLTPQVDWRRLLSAELRRAVAEAAGMTDYSYRRPSRRAAAAPGVVLPSLIRPVPEVAVICDTSGSMTDELLGMAIAEVTGLLRGLGVARSVRVLACDAAVSSVQRVTSASQMMRVGEVGGLTGGGGTDMGAGLAAAAGLRPRPAVAVVLTDGYTPWPGAAPKAMRVICGLLGANGPDGPPWARSVRISMEPIT
jgi:predicted metal-dependent peptidase